MSPLRWPSSRRLRWAGAAGAGLLAVAVGVLARDRAPRVPTAEVTRGEFVEHLELRGDVQPVRSLTVAAPSQAGDLQIVRLVANGAHVGTGDELVQFSTTTLDRTLAEKRSELRQAAAEVDQARAQGRQQEEQDQTALAAARYDVERARLDVKKQEFLSRIDFEKTKLAVTDAEQAVKEAETKLKAGRDAAAAEISRRRQKQERAAADVARAERAIASLTLRAPADGLVTLMPNYRAGSMFSDSPPEFREGDRAWAGAVIAQLPDLSSVRVAARLDETDRSRLRAGQEAVVRVDAVPDREFRARVETISVLARVDFSSWPPVKNFDLTLQILDPDARLRPGMSASIRLPVGREAAATLMPAEALFQRDGRPVAYVLRGSRFEARPVVVGGRDAARVRIVSGVEPGARVALRDPTAAGSAGGGR